jgi:hypothetical protein
MNISERASSLSKCLGEEELKIEERFQDEKGRCTSQRIAYLPAFNEIVLREAAYSRLNRLESTPALDLSSPL